jgi:hypothetical protein
MPGQRSRSPIYVFTIPIPAFTMSDLGVHVAPIPVFTIDRSGRSRSAGTRTHGDCGQVFFLCRRCDRGDRYCSRRCAHRARRATLRAAGRRYQHSWRGRVHHAARQTRYRRRREQVTHQTSPAATASRMVASPLAPSVTGAEGKEATPDVEPARVARPMRPRCARCGRPGRWVRHVTLAHLRPRPTARR